VQTFGGGFLFWGCFLLWVDEQAHLGLAHLGLAHLGLLEDALPSSNVALADSESYASPSVFIQLMIAMAPSQAVINSCASGETSDKAGGTSAMATGVTS
jgi:hypothetical protein